MCSLSINLIEGHHKIIIGTYDSTSCKRKQKILSPECTNTHQRSTDGNKEVGFNLYELYIITVSN